MRRAVISLCLVLAMGLLVAPQAFAYDFFTGACSGGDSSASSVCQTSSNDPITGPNGVIRKVANIVALAAGVVAVIMIIVAGMQYVTSGGDPGKTKTAKNTIIYTVIGLVVIVLTDSILGFVLSKL